MKTLLRLLLLAVLASSALAVDFSYNGVKPDFIIDVRTVGEFQAGHIDGRSIFRSIRSNRASRASRGSSRTARFCCIAAAVAVPRMPR
jgi:hypothetical protein